MANRKMIEQIKWNYQDKGPNYQVNMHIDLDRFEKQYNHAQYALDSTVMANMEPYMPRDTGIFINVTKAMSAALAGTGKVVAAAPPMGRFLYEGKVMVDEVTGSPWARPGARKIVTDRDLTYSNPKATPHWFDTAKEKHGKSWVKLVKKEAGGG